MFIKIFRTLLYLYPCCINLIDVGNDTWITFIASSFCILSMYSAIVIFCHIRISVVLSYNIMSSVEYQSERSKVHCPKRQDKFETNLKIKHIQKEQMLRINECAVSHFKLYPYFKKYCFSEICSAVTGGLNNY